MNQVPDVPFTARNSRIQCCVVGCHNAYYNTDNSIKFYNFPKRWFEKERRQIWIDRVRNVCVDDTSKEWQPKDFHKICSAHFVGNVKSNHPENPSYNPTIFPKENRNLCDSSEKKGRYKKRIAQSCRRNVSKKESFFQFPSLCNDRDHFMEIEEGKKECSCQTDPTNLEDKMFLFESNFIGHAAEGMCDVTTQCNISDALKKLLLNF